MVWFSMGSACSHGFDHEDQIIISPNSMLKTMKIREQIADCRNTAHVNGLPAAGLDQAHVHTCVGLAKC